MPILYNLFQTKEDKGTPSSSIQEVNITPITNSKNTKREPQANILHGHGCKNSQQNTSECNPVICK